MQLNKSQRIISLAGITVIVLMGLFPPWTYTYKYEATYSERPAGYSFIAAPLSPRISSLSAGIKLDLSRLLIQWAITIAALGFGVLLTSTQKIE